MARLELPEFAENLGAAMKARGVKAKALATRLGVPTNQIYRWLDDQIPTRETLESIADALGCPWQWLIVGEAGTKELVAYRDGKWRPPVRATTKKPDGRLRQGVTT